MTGLRLPLGVILSGLGLVMTLFGFFAPHSLVAGGIFAAIGIQLVLDVTSVANANGAWRKRVARILRAWGIAIAAIGVIGIIVASATWLLSPPPPPEMPVPGREMIAGLVIMYLAAFAIAAAIGVWWPNSLERAFAAEMRPGYLIAGLPWAGFVLLDALSRSRLFTSPAAARDWLHDSPLSLGMVLLPLLLVIPMRIAYAGLPQRGPGLAVRRWHRASLIAMLVLVCLGLAVGLGFEIVAGARLFLVEWTAASWAIGVLWVIRLWGAARRACASDDETRHAPAEH